MISFKVRDIFSCRSAGAIIKSVKAVDSGATVRVDMVKQRVEIEPCRADAEELSLALDKAGFPPIPVPVSPAPSDTSRVPPKVSFAGAVDVLLPIE